MGDVEATLPHLPPARKFQRNRRKLAREKASPSPGREAKSLAEKRAEKGRKHAVSRSATLADPTDAI
jgi:hypothetical protein